MTFNFFVIVIDLLESRSAKVNLGAVTWTSNDLFQEFKSRNLHLTRIFFYSRQKKSPYDRNRTKNFSFDLDFIKLFIYSFL